MNAFWLVAFQSAVIIRGVEKNGPRTMSKKTLKTDSWMLRRFPDLNPANIVKGRSVHQEITQEELERANWLWERRPDEITLIRYLLILGVGALGHAIFILFPDIIYLALYHLIYVGVVIILVGRFLWTESRYRKWKQDYLRSVTRLDPSEK
jgi:hypothetical protein